MQRHFFKMKGRPLNRTKRLWLLGAGALLLGACAAVPPGPRTVDISEARLARMLATRFPVDHRYMELLDVSLSQPRLRLRPEDNRIQTELHYALGTVLAGTRQVEGELGLSYGLRYEPSDQTVRLKDVRVDRFDVPGMPGRADRLSRLGGAVTETLMQDAVIHRFEAKDLQAAPGWVYEPGEPVIVPGGLRVTLTPVRR